MNSKLIDELDRLIMNFDIWSYAEIIDGVLYVVNDGVHDSCRYDIENHCMIYENKDSVDDMILTNIARQFLYKKGLL